MLVRPLGRLILLAALLLAALLLGAVGPASAPESVAAAAVASETASAAATAADLFAELRSFAGTVLVPPPGLAPFEGLRAYRVEVGRSRRPGPPGGRYVIQYREGRGSEANGQAHLAGTIGRAEFDQSVDALASLGFRRCAPDATYCAETVGALEGAALASELFRGLAVNDGPAMVEHVTCCGGHYWTLTWFDSARDMTYELVLQGALADRYGGDVDADNLASALDLASIAGRLEPLQ